MKLFLPFLLSISLFSGSLSSAAPPPADTDTLGLSAPSAILMEASTGTILYEKDANTSLHPASITKIMTMILIFDALSSGSIQPDDTVTVSEHAASMGGSQVFLEPGETQTVDTMLKCISVASANDACVAMAEHIAGSEDEFVARMNERAKGLGMNDTNFINCCGLDTDGHMTTAHDVALMSRELITKYPQIHDYCTIWMDNITHVTRRGSSEFGLSNTNKLIRFYDGATGLKTGFTSGAGYCLSASAQREGLGLIAVVMGAESSKIRFQSCKTMLDHGFANYALIRPDLCDVGQVPVVLGKENAVSPKMAQDGTLLIDKAQRSTVVTDVRLEDSVTAPVRPGQPLGTLTLRAGDQILQQIPLVAAEGVERLGFGDLFTAVLRRAAMAKSL